ncbi:MAG: arylsulfotransferase family protein, partial [Planctomycetota bacterium]
DGDVTNQVWLYESFKDHPVFQSRLLRGIQAKRERVLVEEGDAERRGGLDVFHANSVVVLPRDVEGLGKTGDLLLSFRHMNTVASVSAQTGEVLWSWGSEDLVRQHDASLTNDGQVVLFDNRTRSTNSRVVVVDPKTSTVTRTIGGDGARGANRFFSMGRGLAQALPNDNVMVVVSNEGRTFEMTPGGDIVWEFWSPWIRPEARLPFRAVRLEGAVQDTMAKIAAGEMEPPRVPNDVAFKVSNANTAFATDLDDANDEAPKGEQ